MRYLTLIKAWQSLTLSRATAVRSIRIAVSFAACLESTKYISEELVINMDATQFTAGNNVRARKVVYVGNRDQKNEILPDDEAGNGVCYSIKYLHTV